MFYHLSHNEHDDHLAVKTAYTFPEACQQVVYTDFVQLYVFLGQYSTFSGADNGGRKKSCSTNINNIYQIINYNDESNKTYNQGPWALT